MTRARRIVFLILALLPVWLAACGPNDDGLKPPVSLPDGGAPRDAGATPDVGMRVDGRTGAAETMATMAPDAPTADVVAADAKMLANQDAATLDGDGDADAEGHGDRNVDADADENVGAEGNGDPDGNFWDAGGAAVDATAASRDAIAPPLDTGAPPLVVLAVAPSDGATSVSVFSTIVVTFDAAIDPATMIAQPEQGPCAGSVQASTDGFVTCLGFAAAGPVLSADRRRATFTPAPAFSYGSSIAVRITTGATSSDGRALAATLTSAGFTTALPGPSCDSSVVVSQVYGGGGNTSALYSHDFIELHNRGELAVDLTGWSVQYASPAGASWSETALPSAIISGGGYFLIQEGSGGAVGAALDSPDANGTINLGGASGKVALVAGAALLGGACPQGGEIADFIGYGAAGCFEGSGAAPAPPAGGAVVRLDGGCADSDQNAVDLGTGVASPRNAASAPSLCDCGRAPTMNETGLALEADDCRVPAPSSLSVAAGAPAPPIFGRLYEAGTTETDGAAAGVVAELGFGPVDINPSTQPGWTWVSAGYDAQVGADDQYQASFTAPATPGRYGYAYRFSLDAGFSWTYCDGNAAGSNPGLTFETTQLPLMVVTP